MERKSMSLGEGLRRYLKTETRGQLVIKFCGEEQLCKIAIDDGQAVYLSLGKLGPHETLTALAGKQVEWLDFIDGLPPRKRLPHSLNKQLMELAREIRPRGAPPLRDSSAVARAHGGPDRTDDAPQQTVAAIIEDFVDLIGPLGIVLAEKAAQDLGCRAGTPMKPALMERFVAVLSGEIPEPQRQAFIDRYSSRTTKQP
jgi:hypothetical protein